MTKEEILKRLYEITSYYSFGRVLGYIELLENVGMGNIIIRSQLPEAEHLINTERNFLIGLWMHNVDVNKKFSIAEDRIITEEVYSLMNELHLLYSPVANTSIFNQLEVIANYEGDQSYSWQLVKFAQQKYDTPSFADILRRRYHFNIQAIESTYNKIVHLIEKRLKKRMEEKRKKKEYLSPFNALIMSDKELNRHFSKEEKDIVWAMSFRLGEDKAQPINSLPDHNTFMEKPIIVLPNDRGFFFPNFHTLAMSLNETPFYYIQETNELSAAKLGSERGKRSEEMVYEVLRKKFDDANIFKDVEIKKTKSSNRITDIDILVTHKQISIIFQIKSKRLTELSKKGNADSIKNDANAAITDAYVQGVRCIECLEKQSEHKSLRENLPDLSGHSFYNICITTEQYPTITVLSYLESNKTENMPVPLIAMSIYDLDIICQLLSADEIFDYVVFRGQCINNHILAVNEANFLGAFVCREMGCSLQYKQNILSQVYTKIVDHIEHLVNVKKHNVNGIADIKKLLEKYPFPMTQ